MVYGNGRLITSLGGGLLLQCWLNIFYLHGKVATDTTTRIKDLTETQILSAVREMFAGEHVTAIKLEPLIDQSDTFETSILPSGIR